MTNYNGRSVGCVRTYKCTTHSNDESGMSSCSDTITLSQVNESFQLLQMDNSLYGRWWSVIREILRTIHYINILPHCNRNINPYRPITVQCHFSQCHFVVGFIVCNLVPVVIIHAADSGYPFGIFKLFFKQIMFRRRRNCAW